MSGTGGFQTQAYPQPAPAVAGDFASQNPWSSFDAGPGGLVAGKPGVVIGLFAWATPPVDADGTPSIVNNFGAGPVSGFVHRAQQGLITVYLSQAGQTIQPGFQMGLMTGGDFWVVNNGAAQALPGMKAYADLATGKASFAVTGAPTTGASATASSIAAATFQVTGSINNGTLAVTAVTSGTIVAGATISGGATAAGTKIVKQLSGTPGGIGTYAVSIPNQTVASGTINGTYGVLTVGSMTIGTGFAVGDVLNATGAVVAGTTVTQLLTGTGGNGSTLAVDNNTVVASQVISAVSNVETNWKATSAALPGQLVKMSAVPNG